MRRDGARRGAPRRRSPPLGSFPAAIAPTEGSGPPPGALIWAFGEDAPANAGVALLVDPNTVSATTERLGCCVLRITPDVPLQDGDEATVVVSHAGVDAESTFTCAGAADTSAPTLTDATLLDYSGGRLTIGVAGEDDRALAGFLARNDGDVVSAAALNTLLRPPAAPGDCVSVTAVDVVGQQSAPATLCAPADPEPIDAGPRDAGDADAGPGPTPGGCDCAGGASMALLPLVSLARRRRRR